MKRFIGIDGGGTKTEFVLFEENGIILKSLKLEGCNPNDIGIQKCLDILCLGIDTLSKHADAIFLGIAGVTTGNYISMIKDALTSKYQTNISIDSDGANVLSLGKDPNHSASLICGTGSCIFVRHHNQVTRIGGWGYLLDQAGSGYDLGKDALRHTLAVYDKLEQPSLLSNLIEKELGDIWNHISTIYEKGKPYIASFSHHVFEAYQQNDEVAKHILEENVSRIVSLMRCAKEKHHAPFEFIGSGGLFNQPLFKELIEKQSHLSLYIPDTPPVYGACIEVLRRNHLEINQDFKKNFIESYGK